MAEIRRPRDVHKAHFEQLMRDAKGTLIRTRKNRFCRDFYFALGEDQPGCGKKGDTAIYTLPLLFKVRACLLKS